jgi:MraZ protein
VWRRFVLVRVDRNKVAERSVFRGYALQAIDGKGRVALPAPMRTVIERQAGERLLLLSDDAKRGCLRAADQGWSDRLYDRLSTDAERALDAGREVDREEVAAATFGQFDEVPFDASGRFILPPFLRGKGKLTDLAFFWAAGDTIEIWDPRTLLADAGADPAKRERCEWLMGDRGAK